MIPEVAKGQFQLSHLLQSNFLSSYHSPPTHLKYNTKYFNQAKNPIFCWCTNNALSLNTGIGKTMTNGFCGMCQQWDYLSQSWLSSDVKCVFQSPTMPFLSICKWWLIHKNIFFIHCLKRIYLMKIGPPSVFFHSLFTFDLQSQELTINIMSDINSVSPRGG